MSYSDDYDYDSDDYDYDSDDYHHKQDDDADAESVKAWSNAYAHLLPYSSTSRTKNTSDVNPAVNQQQKQKHVGSTKTPTHPNLLSVPDTELLKISVSHSTDIINNKREPIKCQSNQNYIKNQNSNHHGQAQEKQTADEDPNADRDPTKPLTASITPSNLLSKRATIIRKRGI